MRATSHILLPAEWAPQSAMVFVWPRSGGDWGNDLAGARDSIAQAAAAVARDQAVIVIAADRECQADIEARRELAARRNNLQIHCIPANDVWVRDFGPLTIFEHGQRYFVDCRFNGWAGKYAAQLDDRITGLLSSNRAFGDGNYRRREYILEGGAIDSNGTGTLLVTRCCLLSAARNPGDDKRKWSLRLREDFGIETIHWLNHGYLQGDDTDGHVDTLARFVAEDAIAFQHCSDRDDVHYETLNNLADQLGSLRQPNGQPYQLHPLPLPRPQYDDDQRRLPAGYANFLIANNIVLVPQYDDPSDAQAKRVIAACFPSRDMIGIDCRPLIRQNGAIHCAAMQLPQHPPHA